MFSTRFFKETAERAVKTLAQTTAAFFTGVATFSDIGGFEQYSVLCLVPTGLSVLFSIASVDIGEKGSTSTLPEAE